MEDLICHEAWLSSLETPPEHFHEPRGWILDGDVGSFYVTKEESKQALTMCLEKEFSFMPEPGYEEYLHSQGLVVARFRAVLWLVKSRSRFNLSIETVFNAVNYLDRFISTTHFHGWKYWMIDLLSVACFSVASKFNETSTPPLHEIQMEGLDHSFRSSTIQRMELALMRALKWRLGCTTTYSYVELMTPIIISKKPNLIHKDLINQVTKMLLCALLDLKLLEFPPSVIAASAIWNSLQELIPSSDDAHFAELSSLLSQQQKDGVIKYHEIMQAWSVDPFFNLLNASDDEYCCYHPSSPVTVLLKDPIQVDDCQVDLSLFNLPAGSIVIEIESCGKKRKREEE
ncbi:hypothetical protein SLA2020_131580 [Shorea laevis]